MKTCLNFLMCYKQESVYQKLVRASRYNVFTIILFNIPKKKKKTDNELCLLRMHHRV